MIKIILHGGGGGSVLQREKVQEEIKRLLKKDHITMLVVPFARASEDWGSVYEKYRLRYGGLCENKTFVCAAAKEKEFFTQIQEADIIFFTGGNENLLKNAMKNVPFSWFEEKVLVGSSAGANIFSSKYYSNDRGVIEDGIYKLPWNTICHFDEEKNKEAYRELAGANGERETLALHEGGFKTRFVNKYGEKWREET